MIRKIILKKEDLRNRMYKFLDLYSNWSKSAIAKHFKLEVLVRSTIFAIIQRKAKKIEAKRNVETERKAFKMNNVKIKHLKVQFDHKDGIRQDFLQGSMVSAEHILVK